MLRKQLSLKRLQSPRRTWPIARPNQSLRPRPIRLCKRCRARPDRQGHRDRQGLPEHKDRLDRPDRQDPRDRQGLQEKEVHRQRMPMSIPLS